MSFGYSHKIDIAFFHPGKASRIACQSILEAVNAIGNGFYGLQPGCHIVKAKRSRIAAGSKQVQVATIAERSKSGHSFPKFSGRHGHKLLHCFAVGLPVEGIFYRKCRTRVDHHMVATEGRHRQKGVFGQFHEIPHGQRTFLQGNARNSGRRRIIDTQIVSAATDTERNIVGFGQSHLQLRCRSEVSPSIE